MTDLPDAGGKNWRIIRMTRNNANIKRTGKGRLVRALTIMLAMILVLTGCAASALDQTGDSSGTGRSSVSGASSGDTQTYTAAGKSEMFTDRDLSGEYDESEAVSITLSGQAAEVAANSDSAQTAASGVQVGGSTVTITQEGVYIVSGTLADGMVIVDADENAKVQIVLKGASITSSSSAALYVKSADKVFVTTASGTENTLANGGTFTAIDDNNIDGAVFAKDDITFNGSGKLTVTSPAGHGIVGKDDVKIAGGTVVVEAYKHGIQANDSVRIAEADVTITAGLETKKDGIHVDDGASEEGKTSESFFYMADGSLTIDAGDDGIHAESEINIEGGSIDVTESYEGIEALTIKISGGDIKVVASDDGINAAGGDSSTGSGAFGDDDWFGGKGGGFSDGGTDGVIEISGGNLFIQAGGDGIDANGSVTISGGYTVVQGPTQGDTSVLDFNSTGTITGGTFIGTGSSSMAENFTSAENQAVITVSTGNQSAGQTVTLRDSSGNTIAEVTPTLDYDVVYISTPEVTEGSTYTLTAGTYSETIEVTQAVQSSVSSGFGGGRGDRGSAEGDQFGGRDGFGGDQLGNDDGDSFPGRDGMSDADGFRGKGSRGGHGNRDMRGFPGNGDGGNLGNSGNSGNDSSSGNGSIVIPNSGNSQNT